MARLILFHGKGFEAFTSRIDPLHSTRQFDNPRIGIEHIQRIGKGF
ncbi:hypothetical protein DSM110093_00753 [Sulfitobacter sp. DSM 110093]|nr:hypothetical protein DSM110093_00753 [Sulfitobacter sp. DSM 110093]